LLLVGTAIRAFATLQTHAASAGLPRFAISPPFSHCTNAM
jgi:hypothetical protein